MENVPAMSGINESAAALKNGVKTTAVDITEGVLSTSINEMDAKKDGAAAAALNNVESAEALKVTTATNRPKKSRQRQI